jgi:tetratricopeptide (TPR) repeat protein
MACLLQRNKAQEADALFRAFRGAQVSSENAALARINLAACLNVRAMQLKNEFAEYRCARACYEYSLELDPGDATICCNFALLLWSCLGDYPAAALRFEQALKLSPFSGSTHSIFAMFLTHAYRDPQRALEHFRISSSLSPLEGSIPGNFATWHILMGDLSNGWAMAKRSWKLCLPAPDRIMARPLLCATAILLLKGQDASIPLGQMKALFQQGVHHVAWIITALLDELDKQLPSDKAKLVRTVSAAIADKRQLSVLEADPIWQATPPTPLETSWREIGDFQSATANGSA